jgi:hypothetical protein
MFRASTFSAALLLLPRFSLEGVGDGRGAASAAGETAEQASASAIKADPKCFRDRLSEVWISVFISVIVPLFGFWFVMFVICHLFPEIRDEVPGKLQSDRTF